MRTSNPRVTSTVTITRSIAAMATAVRARAATPVLTGASGRAPRAVNNKTTIARDHPHLVKTEDFAPRTREIMLCLLKVGSMQQAVASRDAGTVRRLQAVFT